MFRNNKVSIYSSNLLLYKGLMKSGTISDIITTENISNWSNTLKIVVDRVGNIQNIEEKRRTIVIDANERSIVIWGKLKKGEFGELSAQPDVDVYISHGARGQFGVM